jgi:hypothetical protein
MKDAMVLMRYGNRTSINNKMRKISEQNERR